MVFDFFPLNLTEETALVGDDDNNGSLEARKLLSLSFSSSYNSCNCVSLVGVTCLFKILKTFQKSNIIIRNITIFKTIIAIAQERISDDVTVDAPSIKEVLSALMATGAFQRTENDTVELDIP